MSMRVTRRQLYELVWDQPMTKLAAQFGLSDVGLRKICHKHRVPTPPVGYWAKKAHGKRVTTKPLPNVEDEGEIIIRESSASNEPSEIAQARVAIFGGWRDCPQQLRKAKSKLQMSATIFIDDAEAEIVRRPAGRYPTPARCRRIAGQVRTTLPIVTRCRQRRLQKSTQY
jgi:hypothetical protein